MNNSPGAQSIQSVLFSSQHSKRRSQAPLTMNQQRQTCLIKSLFCILLWMAISSTLLWQLFHERQTLIPPVFRTETAFISLAGREALLPSWNATSHPHVSSSSSRATFSPSGSSLLTDSLNATRKGSKSAESDASLKKLLCVRLYGRLGNNMFQYASTLGLALTLNRTPVFLGKERLIPRLKHSPDPTKQLILEARCKKASFKKEVTCCKYYRYLTQLDPERDFRIGKYLQSYRYFEGHEAEIRKAFVFSDKIRGMSSAVVRKLRKTYTSSTLIGVHVRRGDMAYPNNAKRGFIVPSASFINRSLTFFQKLYPRCVFVVASDSPEWCKDNFPGWFHVHHLPKCDPAVDMLTVASMDHTIITSGTFSWWVGFLNTGKTVCMKDSIVPDSWIGRQFEPKDYIYPDWIPL